VERVYKTSLAERERAKRWALENPEKARANKLRHYLKHRPPLKPAPTPQQRFERLCVPVPECGCWIWTGSATKGYGKVKVDGQHIGAHRWSWLLHKGPIPDGLQVCHSCDVPLCVNPAHLFLGTAKDNNDDKIRKGRAPKMAIHRNPKLTEAQVREIRRQRGKEGVVPLGNRMGVTNGVISRIQRGLSWKHIPFEESDHL
jgi:hypothetical protein